MTKRFYGISTYLYVCMYADMCTYVYRRWRSDFYGTYTHIVCNECLRSRPRDCMCVCVCVYIYIYIYIFVCMYVCMQICVRMYTADGEEIFMVYLSIYMYVCMYVYIYIYIYIYLQTYSPQTPKRFRMVYVCMYMCVYIYIYICMYRHTHRRCGSNFLWLRSANSFECDPCLGLEIMHAYSHVYIYTHTHTHTHTHKHTTHAHVYITRFLYVCIYGYI
jgi:hypothetical protein